MAVSNVKEFDTKLITSKHIPEKDTSMTHRAAFRSCQLHNTQTNGTDDGTSFFTTPEPSCLNGGSNFLPDKKP